MKYKLLALDFDDTLLTSSGEIPQETLKLLERAKSMGVYICPVTGRSFSGAKKIIYKLRPNAPAIVYIGAETRHNGKITDSCYLKSEDSKALVRFARTHNLYIQAYIDDNYCFENHTEYTDLYEEFYGFPGVHIPDMLSIENLDVPKMLFICENDEKVCSELRKQFPNIRFLRSRTKFIECINPLVSKGAALSRVAKSLGIDKTEVIAIGDSEIDVSMIEYAGLGVAVENACIPAKNAADYITLSSDEEGVAHIIKKFILGEDV